MSASLRIEFYDASYRFAHGKRPHGQGSWAFRVSRYEDGIFTPPMTYTQAKQWLKAQMMKQGKKGVIIATVLS